MFSATMLSVNRTKQMSGQVIGVVNWEARSQDSNANVFKSLFLPTHRA